MRPRIFKMLGLIEMLQIFHEAEKVFVKFFFITLTISFVFHFVLNHLRHVNKW